MKRTFKRKRGDDMSENCGYIDHHRLKQLRIDKSVSQKQLAKSTGVSLQGIYRLERSPTVSTTLTLVKLARFFEVPYGFLLGEAEVDLSHYAADNQLAKQIKCLLDKLVSIERSQLEDAIEKFLILLESKSKLSEQIQGITYEEELMGLWWSMMNAYQCDQWETIISKTNRFMELAKALNRPYLAALGKIYHTVALRKSGRAIQEEKIKSQLDAFGKSDTMKSALTLRMRGKALVRRGHYEDALKAYQAAQDIIEQSRRDDALFHLEKSKLLRNISTVYQRQAQKKDTKKSANEYFMQGRLFLERAKRSLSSLQPNLPLQSKIEETLLYLCEAQFYEFEQKTKPALRLAQKALNMANENEHHGIATRTRMYLFHLNMKDCHWEEGMKYLSQLFPLEQYQHGSFERHYRNYVKVYEPQIKEYLKKQLGWDISQ